MFFMNLFELHLDPIHFYSSFDFYLDILFVQFYLILKEKFACILLHFLRLNWILEVIW